MSDSGFRRLIRRLKSAVRTADQKTRQDLRDAAEMLERQHEALIYAGSEQQRRDEKRGLYPQHEDGAN
jgi:thiamine pyrophosphate-dependent acetolactate synthase large subunit-like protein